VTPARKEISNTHNASAGENTAVGDMFGYFVGRETQHRCCILQLALTQALPDVISDEARFRIDCAVKLSLPLKVRTDGSNDGASWQRKAVAQLLDWS
jgi:hypothetical protein